MEAVIKTFTTPKGYYLFDRNTNSILNISAEEYEAVNNKNHVEHNAVINAFQSKGFCLKGKLRTIEHPDFKTLEYHLKNRIEQITMQVTQNCNLRCEYCAYSGNYDQRTHTNKVMDLETMYKCVDFIIQHSRDVEKIAIAFYGGEPLLMIDNIRQCIEYIRQNYAERDIYLTLTTNGTLFNDEIIEFLQKENFHVVISLDGPAVVHDKKRKFADGKGSFDTVMRNVNHIKEHFPEMYKRISFNAVINPDAEYGCIKDFFDAETFLNDTSIRAATVSDLGLKEAIFYNDCYHTAYRYEKMKLLLYALGIIKKEKISRLIRNELASINIMQEQMIAFDGLPEISHHSGPCVPGAHRLFADAEGVLYPCERVSESSEAMKIGHIEKGIDDEKVSALLNIGNLTEEECLHCWNFVYCGMCAAFADQDGCLSKTAKLRHCESMKANTLEKMISLCLFKEMGIDSAEVQF